MDPHDKEFKEQMRKNTLREGVQVIEGTQEYIIFLRAAILRKTEDEATLLAEEIKAFFDKLDRTHLDMVLGLTAIGKDISKDRT